jgi:hypothetical protein
MPRSDPNPNENDGLPGQDSFLDIIANIVGILIILVMVVGVRASHCAVTLHETSSARVAGSPEKPSQSGSHGADRIPLLREEVEQTTRKLLVSRSEIKTMASRITSMSREVERQDQQRMKLNMHRALVEEDLRKRRDQLSGTEQKEFDVQRKIRESQIRLDELTREQLSLAAAPPMVEEVETVSTPLARQVNGEEIHLRLKGGLVSIVPIQSLMDEIYPRVDQLRRTLQERGNVVETFGPIDGYRLRLTLSRSVTPPSFAAPVHLQSPGSHPRSNQIEQYFKFLPVSDSLGQNVEQALLPGAALKKLLEAHRQNATPMTIWVYTDSFDAFRILKRTLWEMNFPVAVRPMAMGDQIGASPHGTRSAAQ